MTLSPSTRQLWAKTGPNDTWHPLWCHLIDVGSVAHAWFERMAPAQRAAVARWLRTDEDSAGRFLAMIAALHDIGKCSPAFQKKSEPHWALVRGAGLAEPKRRTDETHGVVTAEIGTALVREVLAVERPAALSKLVHAAAIHHGSYEVAKGADPRFVRMFRREAPDWWAAMQELASCLASAFSVATAPPAVAEGRLDASLLLWFAGFVSVSDWLGSDASAFPFADPSGDVSGYAAESRTRAAARLDALGFGDTPRFASQDFVQRFGRTPRPLQVACRELVASASSPLLLIVEAPMGEGKTEAALDVGAELSAGGTAAGFYIGLPTQATSNAMHARVQQWLDTTGNAQRVRLAHGAASLVADEHARGSEPVESEREPVGQVWDDERSHAAASAAGATAADWFRSSKRALLEPCGVGTIDQALFGVLFAKHGFVRLAGLAGKVVILDEVHAYDHYTGELLVRLIAWLRAEGCSVVLLSATLPRSVSARMAEAWAEGASEKLLDANTPYPRVTAISGDNFRARHVPADPSRRVEIAVTHLDDDTEATARKLVEVLESGGCAAWICNTVKRAQAAFDAVRTMVADEEVHLLHSRFTVADRKRLEDAAFASFGPDAVARPYRAILVGTQVLEQSLDVDFDVMVTDLAPIDLVLQRAGRLHRHKRDVRPEGVATPALWVVSNTDAENVEAVEHVASGIYDLPIMMKSRMELRASTLALPDDIDPLVQRVYGADLVDLPPQVEEACTTAAETLAAKQQGHRALAARRTIASPLDDKPWQNVRTDLLDDPEDADPVATRLGDRSMRIVLLKRDGGSIRCVSGTQREVDLSRRPPAALVRELVMSSVTVSARSLYGVASALIAARPLEWERVPMLSRSGVVVLDGGVAVIEGVEMSYSQRRGWMTGRSGETR